MKRISTLFATLLASVALMTTAQAAVAKKPISTKHVSTKAATKHKASTKKAATTKKSTAKTKSANSEVNMDIPADVKVNESRSVNGQAVSTTAPATTNTTASPMASVAQ